MWERWNSYTKENGFGDAGMNSFNHYAYGSVLAWMYSTMAGIRYDPAKPGYQHFILGPRPDPRVQEVCAAYRTPYGLVKSSWTYGPKGTWDYTATVPANTTALLLLPCDDAARLSVDGKKATEVTPQNDSLTFLGVENGFARFDALSGTFTAHLG